MKKLIVLLVVLLPAFTFAAGLDGFLDKMAGWLDAIGKMLYAAVVLAFIWGLLKFLFADDIDKEKGKNLMIWGIIAIFVMSAIWGIVAFLGNTLDIQETGPKDPTSVIPKFK